MAIIKKQVKLKALSKKPSQSSVRGRKILESDLQRQILEYLELMGYVYWRNYVGPVIRGYGDSRQYTKNPMAGLPDIVGFFKGSKGKFFGVEVKSSTGKLRPEQERWRDRFHRNGITYWVVRDFTTFRELLQKAQKEINNVCDSINS